MTEMSPPLTWTQGGQTSNLDLLLDCRQVRGTHTWTLEQASSTLCSEQELDSQPPSLTPSFQAPEPSVCQGPR